MIKEKENSFSRLIGEWKTTGNIINGEENLLLEGTDTYEWILDGHFILHKADVLMGGERSHTFEIISMKGPGAGASMQYYNSKGENGTMVSEITGNDFRIFGEKIKFEGAINNGNTEIAGRWFLQNENGDWKDFIQIELEKLIT